MSAIAKRLREIADKCKRHRHQPPTSYEDGEELCRIAAELEAAPAEDAVPVVATVYRNGTGVFGHATLLERWEDGANSLPVGPHRLVTEARHLSAIAALQAQIAELTTERDIMRDNWAAVGTAHEAAMRKVAELEARHVPNREAFEMWFASSRRSRGAGKRPTFARLPDDTYVDDHTQRHWWTWQCALAAPSKPTDPEGR